MSKRQAPSDADLLRWAGLSASDRRLDLFLHDPQNRFWLSDDWTLDGEPALFRSDFLLHFEAVEDNTRLEILEMLPRVSLGRRFLWTGHKGPGWYREIRRVTAGSGESHELLGLALELCSDATSPAPAPYPGTP